MVVFDIARSLSAALSQKFESRFSRPLVLLVAGGSIIVLAVAAGASALLGYLRDREIAAAQNNLTNISLVLAEQTEGSFRAIDLVQSNLIDRILAEKVWSEEEFRKRMSDYRTHLLLSDLQSGLPQTSALSLVDANGKLLNLSRAWPTPDVDLSSRDYFQALKPDSGAKSFIGAPMRNLGNGAWTIYMARRIENPLGDLVGTVVAAIELTSFEDFYRKVELGEAGVISLVRNDGTLLARYPHSDEQIGRSLKVSGAEPVLSAQSRASLVRRVSAIDGQERFASAHKLNNYPLSVTAAKTVDSVLVNWRTTVVYMSIAAGLIAVAIGAIVFLISQQFRKKLREENFKLNAALDNMSQGLVMFDSQGCVSLTNDRYTEVSGIAVGIVKTGVGFLDLMILRKNTGSFQGDPAAYCNMVLDSVKANRSSELVAKIPDGRTLKIFNRPMSNGGWVSTIEDVTERVAAEARVTHLAYHDTLTGLPNRTLFMDKLNEHFGGASAGQSLAVLLLDLDNFKTVNDTLGHHVGDELLKIVSQRLTSCMTENEFVARLGGDEFALVHPCGGDLSGLPAVIKRIYACLGKPCEIDGYKIIAETSIGVAVAPLQGNNSDQLLANADLALYRAKDEERGGYRFFEPSMKERIEARRVLEADLRQALVQQEFEVYYQPLVSLADGSVTGCEALVRWRHPQRGLISPAEFIPVAEETGLINQLGEWVLRTACMQAAKWPKHIKVAVNVSPVQFKNQSLGLVVASVLAESGLAARRLEIELTEAVLVRDDEQALVVLNQIRQLGVRISMDDFGTGYSSLSYIQRFPFDKIKIDRSFIINIARDESSRAIVQAVVDIARSRSMITTAEGVETQSQREMLASLGCTEMQGYLFSAAKPAEEVAKLFGRQLEAEADTARAANG